MSKKQNDFPISFGTSESLLRPMQWRREEDEQNSTASVFGKGFFTIFRWKDSVYRLIWFRFLIYISLYIAISLIYDTWLTGLSQQYFDELTSYCSKFTSSLQIVMLLGFFTATAMQRWFSIMTAVPGTGKVITVFIFSLKEATDEITPFVKEYARWVVLAWALTFRRVCSPLRKAYPDLLSLQNQGLLKEHERIALENVPDKIKTLIVLEWKLAMLRTCARKGYFNTASDLNRNIDALMTFKKTCWNAILFVSRNIPFALIQIVTIAVYSYGLLSLFDRRVEDKMISGGPLYVIKRYFPLLNCLQFFLYYSWLKFGDMASNPFGNDENDINVTALLQSHIENANRLQGLYSAADDIENLVSQSIGLECGIKQEETGEQTTC